MTLILLYKINLLLYLRQSSDSFVSLAYTMPSEVDNHITNIYPDSWLVYWSKKEILNRYNRPNIIGWVLFNTVSQSKNNTSSLGYIRSVDLLRELKLKGSNFFLDEDDCPCSSAQLFFKLKQYADRDGVILFEVQGAEMKKAKLQYHLISDYERNLSAPNSNNIACHFSIATYLKDKKIKEEFDNTDISYILDDLGINHRPSQ